ncbi:MAG TPA: TadE/TadG family type IV pilus assembly protein [Candidatus Dormibacteraeota bacterium]|nr:TadE/TadG family type IV pilus assembly protein [Candidatus Dormibacteraeota bacterium]
MKRKIRKAKTRGGERGVELLELSLGLPILLMLVAGVVDFANAWSTRQILANAAREGARLASTQPMLDLNTTDPGTIQKVCQDVADYLAKANVDTTFMNGTSANPAAGCATPTVIPDSASAVANPVPLGWTYYSSGSYGLEISRTVSVSSSGGSGSVSSTQVILTFPFRWPFDFNRIAGLATGGGGSGYPNVIPIQVNSTMANIE